MPAIYSMEEIMDVPTVYVIRVGRWLEDDTVYAGTDPWDAWTAMACAETEWAEATAWRDGAMILRAFFERNPAIGFELTATSAE